ENFCIGFKNEIVANLSAEQVIASERRNREFRSRMCFDFQMKTQSNGERIESGTEVGGGRRQYDLESCLGRSVNHGCFAPSSAAMTASGSAGRTSGGFRKRSNSCLVWLSGLLEPKRSPRWKFSVYSGSLSRLPVKTSTTSSCERTKPVRTSFLSPARVTAAAGSQPIPSAPISAFAI